MPRPKTQYDPAEEAAFNTAYSSAEIQDFRDRQRQDYERRQNGDAIRRRQVFHKRFDDDMAPDPRADHDSDLKGDEEGEESWRTREGDRLADYGVDEEIEFYDEDEMSLSDLAKRLKGTAAR